MSELKRHPGDIVDGLSIMSPFHKEIKLENAQHPGQQYFYQLNNNPDLLIRNTFIQQQQNGFILNPQQQQQQQQQLFQQPQQNQLNGNQNQFNPQVLPNQFFQPQYQQTQQQQSQQQQQQFQAPILNLGFKPINQQQNIQQQQQQQQQTQQQMQQQQQQQNQQLQNNMQGQMNLMLSQQNSDSSDNHKKSGEKALQFFQTFLQLTQNISDTDLNLDFVKDLYTIKIDSLPSNKEMHEIYHRIVSKQGYSKQQKKNWNDQETNLLVWIILKSCVLKRIDFRLIGDDVWEDISCMMVGRNAEQCKLKWLSMSKLNLQQQPWCDEEDNILRKIIKDYESKNKQNKWSEIAVKLNQMSQKNVFRQGKQCRERWNNHLDPTINRGPWNYEEELKILKLVLEKGKRWSEISKCMKSQRTENAVKNRYNSLVKKEKGSSSSNCLSSANDLKSNQDLTEGEKVQIIALIEKLESRIKNGFSLIGNSSHNLKQNSDLIEEEAEDDTHIQEKQQYEEDDDEDEEDDDYGPQSQSMQSQVNQTQIKTEEGNQFYYQNQQFNQQPSLFQNNSNKSVNSPENLQQNIQKQKNNLPKKNILQSKQALFQMVESEAKIKSEQNLNQSDNQIESGTQLNATINSINQNQNTGGIFQPIHQEINIPNDGNIYGMNSLQNQNGILKNQMNEETISENNSPSMASKLLMQQNYTGFIGNGLGYNKQPGSKRVSLNNGNIFMDQQNSQFNQIKLPSTPLLSVFNHFDTKQKTQNDIFVKSITKKNMKQEEFEDEITKNQLVYVDKNTKEIYIITPQFIQQRIQDEFQRNIVVVQFLQNQESMSTPQQQAVTTINGQVYSNLPAVQGSAASISMFLNTPPLQSQSNTQISQPPQIGSIVQGEQTPTIFQQYYNNFASSISTSNLGGNNNSPSLFFMQYSGNNTPQQIGLAQITPQQNNIHQQQRMINQMPLHQIMQTHGISNNNNNPNSDFGKQNNAVLQSAAMLNKQLIHQDVQQFNSNTTTTSSNLSNTNSILQQ